MYPKKKKKEKKNGEANTHGERERERERERDLVVWHIKIFLTFQIFNRTSKS